MFVFKHPKFYEELRKKRKQFQKEQKELGEKAMKDEATSDKQQAIDETVPHNDIEEAQATSNKRQAPEQDSD